MVFLAFEELELAAAAFTQLKKKVIRQVILRLSLGERGGIPWPWEQKLRSGVVETTSILSISSQGDTLLQSILLYILALQELK